MIDHSVNSLADVGNGGSRQEKKKVTSCQTYTTQEFTTKDHSVKFTSWCWHAINEEQTRRETGYFWLNIHTHRPFSKTHHLMLAWREQTRKETHYSGQTHTHTPFSKTHSLMLAMERADKERNRLLLVKHTHMHNTRPFSKLTGWCWQWREQTRKETGYLWSNVPTYTTQDNSVKLTFWCWQWREHTRKETGHLQSNIHKTSKTHWLMLAMKWAYKEEMGYFWSNMHSHIEHNTIQ